MSKRRAGQPNSGAVRTRGKTPKSGRVAKKETVKWEPHDPTKAYGTNDRVPRKRPCIKYQTHTSVRQARSSLRFQQLSEMCYVVVMCYSCGRFHTVRVDTISGRLAMPPQLHTLLSPNWDVVYNRTPIPLSELV
jgi:hypothetical protein